MTQVFVTVTFVFAITMSIVVAVAALPMLHRLYLSIGKDQTDHRKAGRAWNLAMGTVGLWMASVGLYIAAMGSWADSVAVLVLGVIVTLGAAFGVFRGPFRDRRR